ncbi:MAG: hypothetical protein JW797_07085 [Bradymonadales bacterium]|nr:hypothetical protein [Bradymonadales bacterium]
MTATDQEYDDFCRRLFRHQEQAFKLGTDRIRAALDAHGAPDRSYRSIIVAGTNGKGSVSAFLHAGLVGSGLNVGLFTSPHLLDCRERIRVNGLPISRDDMAGLGLPLLDRWIEHAPEEKRLTFFEILTLMACLYFRERGVDLAVFEVGLGGRLDATNALDRSLAVVTPVGVDHINQLGDQVATNFAEKKAILRRDLPGVVCLPDGWTGEQTRQILADLEPRPLWLEDADFGVEGERLRVGCRSLPTGWIPLPGAHQRRNAACALAALEAARLSFRPEVADLERQPLLLARTRWPGRWTALAIAGKSIHLDCAHNPQGARAAALAIDQLLGRPVTLIMAVMARKQHTLMLDALLPHAERVVAVPLSDSDALPAGVLAEAVQARGVPCLVAPTLREGLQQALALEEPVVCLGSIYLAGEVLRLAGLSVEDLEVLAGMGR